MVSGLLPIAAWALYLSGGLSAGATLVAVATLGAARWFAWTTASLVSQLPSARVWTRRTVAMCGVGGYSAAVPGVFLPVNVENFGGACGSRVPSRTCSRCGQTASGPSVLPTAGRSDRTGRTISKRAGRSDRPGGSISKRAGRSDRPGKGRSRRGQGGPTDPGGTLLIARGRSDRLRRRAGLPVADATPRRRSPPPLPYPRWSPFRTSSRRLRRRARRTARAPWSPGRARTIAGSSPRGGTPRRPAPAA